MLPKYQIFAPYQRKRIFPRARRCANSSAWPFTLLPSYTISFQAACVLSEALVLFVSPVKGEWMGTITGEFWTGEVDNEKCYWHSLCKPLKKIKIMTQKPEFHLYCGQQLFVLCFPEHPRHRLFQYPLFDSKKYPVCSRKIKYPQGKLSSRHQLIRGCFLK